MLKLIKRHWPTALAALFLLSAISGVYAKYVTDTTLSGTVSITAELGTIQLLEHKVARQADGSYKKLETTTTTGNTYDIVLPGLDIPKDPYVTITDKSAIPAYVFLKIEKDTLTANEITYELTSDWKLVDNQTDVYVYAKNGMPVEVTSDVAIPVLKDDQVIVSQELDKTAKALELSFSACMKQYVAGKTVQQIYEDTTEY